MSDITAQLLKIKNKIELAKTTKSEIKGKISSLTEQLEKNFKVKSVEAAEKTLDKMDKELDEMKQALKKGFEELEKAYDWD